MYKYLCRRLYLSTITSLLLLAACGGGGGGGGDGSEAQAVVPIDPATINFIPHFSSNERMSLVFPESWERRDSLSFGDPEIVAAFSEPAQGPSDRFLENVVLHKLDSMSEVVGDDVTDIREISNKQIVVAGFPAEETIFDAKVSGAEQLELRFMSIAFEFEGSIYGLIYSAERTVFERNTEIVRYMASQLKIGQLVIDNVNRYPDFADPGKPAVANDGSNFLVVSCRESTFDPFSGQLVGRIVKSDRTMGPEFQIDAGVDQGSHSCADFHYGAIFDDMNYLVTYVKRTGDLIAVVGRRITATGELVDSSPIEISQNQSASARVPDLVFDGNRTLVVWYEYEDDEASILQRIQGAFVDQNGEVSEGFLIDDIQSQNYAGYSPDLAYGDNQFMVIWSPYFFDFLPSTDFTMPIYGQILDLNGNPLLSDSVLIREDNGGRPRYPQIASDGTNYVVSWIEGELDFGLIGAGNFTVYARQIDSLGQLVDSNASQIGVEIAPHLTSTQDTFGVVSKDFLDLSYHEGNYLFLWTSKGFGPATGVYGVRASSDLDTISTPKPIAGLNGDTIRGDMLRPSLPVASYTDAKTFVLWPSLVGSVEGWFIGAEHFQ